MPARISFMRVAVALSALAIVSPGIAAAQTQGPKCESLRNPIWSTAGISSAIGNLNQAAAAAGSADFAARYNGSLAGALKDCGDVVSSSKGRNVYAQACVGRAQFLLGNSAGAYCPLTNAIDLGRNPAAGEPASAIAAAYETRARLRESTPGYGDRNAVADDYAQAVSKQPTGERYLALARAQAPLSVPEADASYARVRGGGSDARLVGVAMRERARLRQANPQLFSAQKIQEAWQQASESDSSAEGKVEYGKALLAANDPRARSVLASAVAPGASADPGAGNFAGEAWYLVALIDARALPPSPSTAQWSQIYDNVRNAGLGDQRYRRLHCIAYIGRAGAEFSGADSASPCTADPSAEGLLLRGMYYLKRAQKLPPDCQQTSDKQRCTNGRLTAFLSMNENALNAFAASGSAGEAVFNWLDLPAPAEPKLRDMMAYGASISNQLRAVNGCSGSQPPGAASVKALYQRLDLFGCAPSRGN